MQHRRAVALLAFLALAACGPGSEEAAQEASPFSTHDKFLRVERAVPNEYIVVFNEVPGFSVESISATAEGMAASHGGQVLKVYGHALQGYWAKMTEQQALALSADPQVKYVQENSFVSLRATQSGATWGLDRIDQRDLPLSSSYTYNARGTGVHAYIIDTGVHLTHQEFAGRMGNNYDVIGTNGNDCHGHGTHVAATIGGTTYGVAKNVTLHSVRVLDCEGGGTEAGVVAGVDWVTANRQSPAVANMSLGGDVNQAMDDAVARSISSGVTYAVAAGNENANACLHSPARTPAAITVGATDNTDSRAWFSNFGTCVDIFAPGESITSAWNTSNTATNTISGTSMATPHVVGAAALYLERNPTATPLQVRNALVNNGTAGKVTNPGTGSPNVLLYIGFIPPTGNEDTTPPTATLTAPSQGATVSGNVTLSASASDNVGVSRVDFEVDGVFAGSDSSAPYSFSWPSTTVENGNHSIVARAHDAAGNSGGSASATVSVNNPGFASYDATLKAPKCGTVGALCATGNLVKGRGPLGPEPNAPNTINNSCADGASGTYQEDETLESLKVFTSDGSSFAAGKTVTIEAKVWAYTLPDWDALDLYYAANANSPSWTYLTTLYPEAGGLQTLSTTHTLPSGSLQAIRGVYRFFGSASPCDTSSWNDRDDLIFAVGGGGGGGGDTTRPTTSLTAPSSGATLSGAVTVSASASDNIGVTKVEFYAGSTLISTDTSSPYSISWTTSTVANGTYALTSKAYDAANNVGTSTAVSVTVSNTSGGCGITEQFLLNPGFESGSVNWTASSGVIASDASTARTGSWRALLGGKALPATYTLTQTVTVPASACSATVKFWLWVSTSEFTIGPIYDSLVVEVQNSSGTVLGTLASYSNLDGGSAYVQQSFDVAAYKGQTVRLSFTATEDDFNQTSFIVDDASLTITR